MSKLNYQSEKPKNKKRHGWKTLSPEKIHQRMLKFEARAKLVHHGKYIYHQDYKNMHAKISITCPEHGDFYQQAQSHLRGCGCSDCGILARIQKRTSDWQTFETKANLLYGGIYLYHQDYVNSWTNVRITCLIHGDFWKTPNHHLCGEGCQKCTELVRVRKRSSTWQIFEMQANEVHGGIYEYHQDYVNNHTDVCITCHEHGNFWQQPNNHLNGQGCPKCKASKGEKAIEKFLTACHIIFETEWRFPDCRDCYTLPFDFWISSLNLLIEFDGQQHFNILRNNYWGGRKELKKRQLHDQIKTTYCKAKGYRLIRIHYNDIKRIPEILSKELNLTIPCSVV